MGKPLRLGIAGCGDIAAFTAWFAWLNPGIRLAACCDVNVERAQKFAARYRIPLFFMDYDRMLAEADLDAVYLAVPHHLHAQMIRRAVQRGLPVLTEKPLTRTLDEGLELARLVDESGARVAVNYQYRYDSGCYALARAVQDGAVGQVQYARVNIPWHRTGDYFSKSIWHQSIAQAGGGTLITQGSHFLDVVLWACAAPARCAAGITAKRVFEDVEVEDTALGILELESGALVEICSSMAAASEQAVRIEIYGSKGSAFYTNLPFPRTQFRGIRVKQARPPVWGIHALQRSIEGFRRWAVGGAPHLTPLNEALPVLAAVEAVYRSAASGSREPVFPARDIDP